ncbi:MAG: M3 family metallopeptidase, partial [Sphingomicrobium sp.]
MNHHFLGGCAALAFAGGFAGPALAQSAPAAAAAVPSNVLLAEWKGPYDGVPPWDQVKPEQFDEAIQFAIDDVKREYAAIVDNPAAPTWENTIDASEKAGERLSRVLSVFGVMTDNMSTDAYVALDKKWSPKLSAAFDEIRLNPKLFQRVETLYNNRDTLGLDAKQMRLLTREYEGLVRNGAKLDAAQKAKLTGLN